jgi:hypothetical protein
VTTTQDLQPAPDAPVHDLVELARRFPDGFVERKDGNDYVAHHVVNQRLLSIVGPFDFELVQVIRGDVPAVAPDPQGRSRRARAGTPELRGVVVGGIWRLTCTIDGRRVRVEEVGDVGDVHNWPHDGARLKDAASDALKRCAMRLGLGLHLWAQEHYFLDRQVRAVAERSGSVAEAEEAVAGRAPRHGDVRPVAPADLPTAGDGPGRAAAAGEAAQAATRMPPRGTPGWEAPEEELVRRFDALVEAAGVSAADAREFLRRSPHYGGAADPRDLHGPTLARLVERLEQDGERTSGLAAFRAKVAEVLADRPQPAEPTAAPAAASKPAPKAATPKQAAAAKPAGGRGTRRRTA